MAKTSRTGQSMFINDDNMLRYVNKQPAGAVFNLDKHNQNERSSDMRIDGFVDRPSKDMTHTCSFRFNQTLFNDVIDILSIYRIYSSMTDGVARYYFIFRKDILLSLQLSSECIVALDKFVCKFCRSQKTGRRTASKSRPNKKRTRSNMSRVNEMITVYRLLSSYRRARRE